MLDLDFVRENIDLVKDAIEKKGTSAPIDEFKEVDKKRRELIQEVEELKQERNQSSQKIGELKREGKDEAAQEIIDRMQVVADEIKELDKKVKKYNQRLEEIMLQLPNIPQDDVPFGEDEADNVSVKTWGEPRQFDFSPQAHWDLGVDLDILDFEKGAKVSGARFTFLKQSAAKLERALIDFMIDVHTKEHDYEDVFPPFMVH